MNRLEEGFPAPITDIEKILSLAGEFRQEGFSLQVSIARALMFHSRQEFVENSPKSACYLVALHSIENAEQARDYGLQPLSAKATERLESLQISALEQAEVIIQYNNRSFICAQLLKSDPSGLEVLKWMIQYTAKRVAEKNKGSGFAQMVESGMIQGIDSLKALNRQELPLSVQGALAALEDYEAVWNFFQALQKRTAT